jgi:hypothetical protein
MRSTSLRSWPHDLHEPIPVKRFLSDCDCGLRTDTLYEEKATRWSPAEFQRLLLRTRVGTRLWAHPSRRQNTGCGCALHPVNMAAVGHGCMRFKGRTSYAQHTALAQVQVQVQVHTSHSLTSPPARICMRTQLVVILRRGVGHPAQQWKLGEERGATCQVPHTLQAYDGEQLSIFMSCGPWVLKTGLASWLVI